MYRFRRNFPHWILRFSKLQPYNQQIDTNIKNNLKQFGFQLQIERNIVTTHLQQNNFINTTRNFLTNQSIQLKNQTNKRSKMSEDACKGQKKKSEYLKAPKVKLNNGLEMPVLGLGTYQSLENEGEEAIKYAIDLGYRHIDTAFFYQNEHEVGKAVKDKIAEKAIKREDVFIVTKLWCTFHEPNKVEYACKKSLENLGLDYIDLYLMHVPVGYVHIDDKTLLPKDDTDKLMLNDVDYLDTWKAMEDLVKKGYVKSIGISNFNSEQIDRILKNCEIKPVTNQVECCPTLNQKKLIEFCKERDITVTAYCPLGRPRPHEKKPDFMYSDETLNIAKKCNKTPAQVILRYLIDIGTIPIPKSSNKGRILENFDIFDFKLNSEELQIIDKFNTGERLVPFNLIKGQNHKYFPFNIEF